MLDRPIHHVGYSVADLSAAIAHFRDALGVGPFLVFEDITFDEATHLGAPLVFEHSAGFAKWGPIFIELQEINAASPPAVASVLRAGEGAVVNHTAYLSSTPEEDSAQLEKLGMPAVLHLRSGPIVEWIHSSPLGHAIEVHTASAFLDGFFAAVAEAADGWDGRDAVRVMSQPR
jgi:catechol 2,3-dioxygenase-like lactoylglutathione lyase family enzyme